MRQGHLALALPDGYASGRSNWREGPRGSLEARLDSVFEVLETRATRDDELARRAEQRVAQMRREDEQREASARLLRIETARVERLEAEVAAWERSARLRRYLAALRERLAHLPGEEQQRLADWCAWVEECVERSDPVRNTSRIRGFDDEGAIMW